MRLFNLLFIVSALTIAVSAPAKRTDGWQRPMRLDGKPIADTPLQRMAQGDAYAVDHLTHRPVEIRPEANHRLIFAVAFEREDEAIWAFKNGATATEAIALCKATKEQTENNYGTGTCEKVEARFSSLRDHETNYRNMVRLVVAGATVAAVTVITGVFFCGRCVINKLKKA